MSTLDQTDREILKSLLHRVYRLEQQRIAHLNLIDKLTVRVIELEPDTDESATS